MKTRLTVSLMMGLLVIEMISAAQQDRKAAFEATRTKMNALHGTLISAVAPPVRSRITASAGATLRYVARCKGTCDLYPFMSRDLKGRFTRLTDKELDILIGLVLAETLNTDSELLEVRIHELEMKRELLTMWLQKLLSGSRETQMSVVKNIKP